MDRRNTFTSHISLNIYTLGTLPHRGTNFDAKIRNTKAQDNPKYFPSLGAVWAQAEPQTIFGKTSLHALASTSGTPSR